MVTRGLVTRERKPGGPEIVIALSDAGRALHAQMVGWVVERDARLTEGLAPDDLAALWRASDSGNQASVLSVLMSRTHHALRSPSSGLNSATYRIVIPTESKGSTPRLNFVLH
jgi:DNA-binding MarR family transcriptional regulator